MSPCNSNKAVVLHLYPCKIHCEEVHIKVNDVIILLTFAIVLTAVRAIINDIKK